MRLFKVILILMLIASVVPTAMVGLLAVSHTREILVRDAQELSGERVQQLRLKTESLLGEPTRAVMGLTHVPHFFSLPASERQAQVQTVLDQRREVALITLYAPDGQLLVSLAGPGEQGLVAHQARARSLLQGLSSVRYSEVYETGADKVPAVTVALPVGNPVTGYLAAQLTLDGLSPLLRRQSLPVQAIAYVTDIHGRLVAGPGLPNARLGTDLSARPAVRSLLQTLGHAKPTELFRVGNFGDGADRVAAAYAVLPEAGWAVVSEEPLEVAYAQVATMERTMGWGVLTALVVALILAATFSRRVTRPLHGLMKSALEIARGQFGTLFPTQAKNELGELAQTFNYMSQQLMAYDQETRGLYESLEKGYLETIVALANSIDSKDSYTRGHSQRVGDTAVEIGRELGLHDMEIRQLRYGGILHDIGKIGIVETILLKQTQLTAEEMTVMREHPAIGDSIINPVGFLKGVRAAVRSHHERWDGTGYPDKLQGEQIPLIARIVGCADTFDACTSTRPYQKAMSLDVALDIMDKLRGASLDPKVVDALHRVIEKKGVRMEGQGQPQPVKLAS